MNATEELRRLLDERGVEWETDRSGFRVMWGKPVDEFHDTMQFKAVDNALPNGGLNVHICGFTPEQAIAATLGRGECKPMTYDNGYSMDHIEPGEYYEFWEPACACSECGELIPMRRFCPNCGRRIVEPTTNDVDAEVADG